MNEYAIWFLAWCAVSVSSVYALFVFYAAVMNIKRVRDAGKMTTFAKVVGYPTLAIGLALDLFVNVFVMTVLFLELPQEMTVTSRMKRHNSGGTGWRKDLVSLFEPLLDPLDPSGDHV